MFAKGALDWSFLRGSATCESPSYNWYISMAIEEIERLSAEAGGERVLLVGHSAGPSPQRTVADRAMQGVRTLRGIPAPLTSPPRRPLIAPRLPRPTARQEGGSHAP